MMDEPSRALVPDDLELLDDGNLYELIDGVPEMRPCGARASEIAGLLLVHLGNYVRPRGLGRIFNGGLGYCCFPDPRRVLVPNGSFVATDKIRDDEIDGWSHLPIPPDIVWEIAAPDEPFEYIEAKIRDYRSAGVKLIWIVSPKCKNVMVRRLDGTCTEVDENGELNGEDVVPGFTCKVADLFD